MGKYQITVTNNESSNFECGEDQDLLGQAIRARVPVIVACRSGGCGICKIKVIHGQYERGICSKKTLPDQDRENNYSLACKTYPKSDMVIAIENMRSN